VGLLQTAPVFGAIEENLARIAELGQSLGAVDLALTPELSATGYGFAPHREGELLDAGDTRLGALAGKGIGIGFAERSPSGLPWNSYLLGDPATGAEHLQRKLHPVSYAPWNEHHSFQPGAALETVSLHGTRTATVICNDMWHPVVPWLASRSGAEVLIVPVASIEGSDPGAVQRIWQIILEHTAVLLQCYVVFVNRCGTDSGARFWGGSRVLGPDGSTIARLGDEPGAAAAELDLGALRRIRSQMPLLAESRTDFVAEALGAAPGPRRRSAHV
jgi:predicted amidohydrolase